MLLSNLFNSDGSHTVRGDERYWTWYVKYSLTEQFNALK